MKRFLWFFISILCLVGASAQSADGRYTSRMTQDGTLIFIQPHKINKLSGISRFEYDMTLLSWTDSVTINFTFESKFMDAPTDLKILSGNDMFVCNSYSPLFIDIKKDHYEVRITSKFSTTALEQILESTEPPIFSFSQQNHPESASYKPGAWKKDRKKLLNIFHLYKHLKK